MRRDEKLKFTVNKDMGTIKRVEAWCSIPDVCSGMGINTVTCYKWRVKKAYINVSVLSPTIDS
jgi:hypothetical protein